MSSILNSRSYRNLAIAGLLPFVSLLAACGGGGGHGGGGSNTSYGPTTAVLANSTYSDVGSATAPTISDEAGVVISMLRRMGHTARPFTGITAADINAAVSGAQTLVIPELENGDLNAALTASARSAIASYVNGGGTLVIHGDSAGRWASLLNATFGYSLTATAPTAPISRQAPAATGTPYENCGAGTVGNQTGQYGMTTATLPAGGKAIYTGANGATALAYIPYGSGRIIFASWDGYDAKPVGTLDNGWWGLLYRAYRMRETLPNVAILAADSNSNRDDVLSSLKANCQFQNVTALSNASTPTLGQLQAYDAVLVWSNVDFADSTALGNVMADYVDSGRGVVLAMFDYTTTVNRGLRGRFETDNYYGIPASVGNTSGIQETASLSAFAAGHAVLAGVSSFDGGTSSFQPNTNLVVAGVGATRLANWSDGSTPLVVTRAIGSARRVDLGFFPASSVVNATYWDAATDGDKLMANALSWASKKQYEPPFQSFSVSPGLAILDLTTIQSNLVVANAPTSISKVRVTLNITHTFVGDLDIFLEAPDATMIELTTDNGGNGDNMTNTVFDDSAPTALTAVNFQNAPFTASYIAEVPLAGLNGRDANGTWILHVTDDAGADVGTLNSWTLEVR